MVKDLYVAVQFSFTHQWNCVMFVVHSDLDCQSDVFQSDLLEVIPTFVISNGSLVLACMHLSDS